jgi:hypothetical protein
MPNSGIDETKRKQLHDLLKVLGSIRIEIVLLFLE